MKTWLKENWFKLIISLGVLIGGISLLFYFVIRPTIYQQKLANCLLQADSKSESGFAAFAKPKPLTKDECFRKYPQ